MTTHPHAVVWLDHKEARVFHVDLDTADETTLRAPHRHVHRHPKGTRDYEHPEDARHFFHEVARALDGVDEVLVVGPSTAKLQFLRYLHEEARPVEARIVGVESADHPTNRQVLAHARQYFHAKLPRIAPRTEK